MADDNHQTSNVTLKTTWNKNKPTELNDGIKLNY